VINELHIEVMTRVWIRCVDL